MPIIYKDFFGFTRDSYPYVTMYDNEDKREVCETLKYTTKIAISLGDLEILSSLPQIERIVLLPGAVTEQGLRELYSLQDLKLLAMSYYETDAKAKDRIDLSHFSKLSALVSNTSLNFIRLDECGSIQTIKVLKWKENSFQQFSGLRKLDTVDVSFAPILTLDGIENTALQCLHLSYCRNLKDISAIMGCENLKLLRIENCPRIINIEQTVKQLNNLVSLSITGKGEFQNLSFISDLNNLKFFVSDYNVADGNLTALKNLPYASILQNRRHYNIKDDDLPRENSVSMGNEDIPIWRRIE